MSVDVSVVVVAYNSRDVLPRCLDSIREHTRGVTYEIIVVDNASPDGTGTKIADTYADVRVIYRATNGGLSAAINDGVAASSGTHIAQLNPDVRLTGDALTALAAHLRAADDVGVVAPKLLDDDGSLQLSCRAFPGHATALFNRYSLLTRLVPGNRYSRDYLMSGFDHTSVRDVDWVSGAALMLPRRVLDAVGGWDAGFFMFSEDVDLCKRVHDAGYRVVYDPRVAVYHTIGVSKHASARLIIERHRSMWRYYRKHLRGNAIVDAATAGGIAGRCAMLLASHGIGQAAGRF